MVRYAYNSNINNTEFTKLNKSNEDFNKYYKYDNNSSIQEVNESDYSSSSIEEDKTFILRILILIIFIT